MNVGYLFGWFIIHFYVLVYNAYLFKISTFKYCKKITLASPLDLVSDTQNTYGGGYFG